MEGSRADAKHIADELCQAYLSHSLTRRGYSDAIPRTMIAACLSADVSRVFKFLQPLADSFEDLAPDVFHDLIPCLHITARTAYKLFDHLALEIFADGVNWGKIAALYALAGAVAVECVRRNWKRGVRSVYVCFSTFIREHLLEWIVDHDGWVDETFGMNV